MKILLTAINAKYIHSNLAVYSLKAYSEKYGNIQGIKLFESTINNKVDDILDEIYEEKPDIVAFSCYIWNISFVYALVLEIKKLLPNCDIWLGGPEVSYNSKDILKKYKEVNVILCGEGEETFLRVCKEYEKNELGSLSNVKGIVYRDGDKIRETPVRMPINLSTVPFQYENIDDFKNKIVYYETSRGCPFSCSYCLSSVEKQLRFRDLDLVKLELQFFIDHNVPQVKFVDRTFNCKKSHAMEIWRYIYENDNGITNFHFEIAADLMDDDEIELISKMRPGLIQLEIGVQSTNEKTIKEINRIMNLTVLKDVVGKINKSKNIHQHLDLIAGLPYEDYGSFKKSFNDVYKMNPNQLQLGFLKVLTGSAMAEGADKYGIVFKNFPPYEVLYTKWITYDEVLKLKMVEEVVEIYYNSGQFTNAIKFLENSFEEPFALYESLGNYYKQHYPKNLKHSRIDRYNILLKFYEDYEGDEDNIKLFKEIMTYDIFLRENMHTRPSFSVNLDIYKEEIRKISQENNLTRSEHIEPISNELLRFLNEDYKPNSKNNYILFDYKKRDKLTNNAITRLVYAG